MSVVLAAIVTGALTWAGERIVDKSLSGLKAKLRDSAAKDELTQITIAGIEAGIAITPSIGDDLRSETFIHGVVGPIVIDRLGDPSIATPSAQLAQQYIERFVAPWAKDGSRDSALTRIFQTDRASVERSMEAVVDAIRTGLFASDHWKDEGRDRTIAETYRKVSELHDVQSRRTHPSSVDVETAKADSKAASQDLLEWQRTIGGLFMDRAELDLLANRIRTEPRGRTLLVGEAGAGKSALLSELTERLQAQGMTVFAVKADMLPSGIASIADLSNALGLNGNLEDELNLLAASAPVVFIVDQMDAVSDVMDRTSQRMKLLLRVANGFTRDRRFLDGPPVHVIVSSRPFEAAHDGRFQSLGAETIKLGLPSSESVNGLLKELGIDAALVTEGLKETLRRPFALRLFVELVGRGVDVTKVTASELLNAWLISADLGDEQRRPKVMKLLEQLAADMTETETLWRPSDTFDLTSFADVKIAQAAGIVIRQDAKLGFSHQSWLDDFQAKAFSTGASVASFAWERQDGLFARATILRALERLRRHDVHAYEAGLDLMLGESQTRRHLKHLVVDLISSQDSPTSRELGWIQKIFQTDMPLARRAVGKVAERWVGWRAAMQGLLPAILANPELRWASIRFVQAEAEVDADGAIELLSSHWAASDRDLELFEAFWRAKLWSPWVARRIGEILERHDIQDFAVTHYVNDLTEAGRFDEAVQLVTLYLIAKPVERRQRRRLHDLDKLVQASPQKLAVALTPWFISLVTPTEETPKDRAAFYSAHALPFDWDRNEEGDNVFTALRHALALSAKADPGDTLSLVQSLAALPVAETQALAAETLTGNPEAFAQAGLQFLLDDARRLAVGEGYFEDETGCSRHVHGWASKQLISAIAPYLGPEELSRLKELIATWDQYAGISDDWSVADRMHRRRWTEDARLSLLERLPENLFTAREMRRIREWRADQPVLRPGRSMASFVGAPMSTEQMSKATDDDLMRLLDECHDGTEWGDRTTGRRRHISKSGGAIQVGRTFAALSKQQPERVIRLIRTRLSAERHQQAAGSAVGELAENVDVPASEVINLIRFLDANGFVSEDWRCDAAWAFQKLARRVGGLEGSDLRLIEGWVVDDVEVAASRTARRLELDALNKERNHKPDEVRAASAVIFGNGFGRGFGVLPQGNYAHLSAIAAGLLCQDPVNCDAWLAVLERHAERAEDPHIWETVLAYHGSYLFWADRHRVGALFKALWAKFPDAFSVTVGGQLWSYREMVPAEVQTGMLDHWGNTENQIGAQAAGEFCIASLLVDGSESVLASRAGGIMDAGPSAGRLGGLFAAAAAWRQNAGRLRDSSHAILTRFAGTASGDEAEAISTALDGSRVLLPDPETEAMLGEALQNEALLAAALSNRFADALQVLLLHPGFEEIVLTISEKCVDRLVAEDTARRGLDSDFVSIAVALQRAQGEQRVRAMDLYERLLDAGAYGADQAAAASIRH